MKTEDEEDTVSQKATHRALEGGAPVRAAGVYTDMFARRFVVAMREVIGGRSNRHENYPTEVGVDEEVGNSDIGDDFKADAGGDVGAVNAELAQSYVEALGLEGRGGRPVFGAGLEGDGGGGDADC